MTTRTAAVRARALLVARALSLIHISSDSIPFADNGIPAINFSRDGAKGAAYIHNRFDTMEFLSAEALGKTLEIVLTYADTLINAAVFPVEKKIPDNIKEDIDKYLYKKELAEAEAK